MKLLVGWASWPTPALSASFAHVCRPGGLHHVGFGTGFQFCALQRVMKALVVWTSWPTPASQRASLACAGQEAYTTWIWQKLSSLCAAESYEAPRRLRSLVQAGRPALRRGLDYGSHRALGA